MEDTDTLIALLSSLVHPRVYNQDQFLDALVKCDGIVEDAAKFLQHVDNSRGHVAVTSRSQSRKRKRISDLNEWITASSSKQRSSSGKQPTSKPSSRSSTVQTPVLSSDDQSSKKPVSKTNVNIDGIEIIEISDDNSEPTSPSKLKNVTQSQFMALLRPPNSSEGASKSRRGPPKHPPLMLGTPALVDKHTPCTLHPSILPPELACR